MKNFLWGVLLTTASGIGLRGTTYKLTHHREITALHFGRVAHEACGVSFSAYGDLEDRYFTAALANVLQIRAMEPAKGWCPTDPELSHIPVTLFTNAAVDAILDRLNHTAAGVSVVSNSSFEPLPVNTHVLDQGWWREGDPRYRWYHCQGLVHAPFDLTLYLDADIVICAPDRIATLFQKFAKSGADMAFEIAVNEQGMPGLASREEGFYCTNGDASMPHPASVQTSSQKSSWLETPEPNAGVILSARRHPAMQKVASDWCELLAGDMRGDVNGASGGIGKPMPCDQYALRAAMWKHRDELKPLVLEEDNNDVCRYTYNTDWEKGTNSLKGCSDGCAIVHGWAFPEVQALIDGGAHRRDDEGE
jgi:hypothetical protein